MTSPSHEVSISKNLTLSSSKPSLQLWYNSFIKKISRGWPNIESLFILNLTYWHNYMNLPMKHNFSFLVFHEKDKKVFQILPSFTALIRKITFITIPYHLYPWPCMYVGTVYRKCTFMIYLWTTLLIIFY